jgi:hypothetical protein
MVGITLPIQEVAGNFRPVTIVTKAVGILRGTLIIVGRGVQPLYGMAGVGGYF